MGADQSERTGCSRESALKREESFKGNKNEKTDVSFEH